MSATKGYIRSFLISKNIDVSKLSENDCMMTASHFTDQIDFVSWMKNVLTFEALEEEFNKEKDLTDSDIAAHNNQALMIAKSMTPELKKQLEDK